MAATLSPGAADAAVCDAINGFLAPFGRVLGLSSPSEPSFMNGWDAFIVSFGIAFFLASGRCKQWLVKVGYLKGDR